MLRFWFMALLILCIAGCSTDRLQQRAVSPDGVALGTRFDSLASDLTLAYRTPEKNLAGRGMLVYQRPDRMHLVILSPLGTKIMGALVEGNQLTLVYPVDRVAFKGTISQLPQAAGQQAWGLLQWVMDMELPSGTAADAVLIRLTERGTEETLVVKHGLLIEKRTSSGDRVRYGEFRQIQGQQLATELQIETRDGDRLKLGFVDPELNLELGSNSFEAGVGGMRLLPLSELRLR